ncbi:hypothetical protein C8R43DRAFT_1125141 [Mycena crocata]|nr:hypothetical protein C8R43DRAFT_1125141 [Mycena crocata]
MSYDHDDGYSTDMAREFQADNGTEEVVIGFERLPPGFHRLAGRSPRNSLSEESTSSIDPPVQEFRICCLPVVQTHRVFFFALKGDFDFTSTPIPS